MKRIIALILVLSCVACLFGCGRGKEPKPTGYPAGEIQQPQVMYNGKIYFYFATGFDAPLPGGYACVGEIETVDNLAQPTEDFVGARVELGQQIYADANCPETIYLQYESGYAKFEIRQ